MSTYIIVKSWFRVYMVPDQSQDFSDGLDRVLLKVFFYPSELMRSFVLIVWLKHCGRFTYMDLVQNVETPPLTPWNKWMIHISEVHCYFITTGQEVDLTPWQQDAFCHEAPGAPSDEYLNQCPVHIHRLHPHPRKWRQHKVVQQDGAAHADYIRWRHGGYAVNEEYQVEAE